MTLRLRIENHVTIDLEKFPNPAVEPDVRHDVRGRWRVFNGSRPKYEPGRNPYYRYSYKLKVLTIWANCDNWVFEPSSTTALLRMEGVVFEAGHANMDVAGNEDGEVPVGVHILWVPDIK